MSRWGAVRSEEEPPMAFKILGIQNPLIAFPGDPYWMDVEIDGVGKQVVKYRPPTGVLETQLDIFAHPELEDSLRKAIKDYLRSAAYPQQLFNAASDSSGAASHALALLTTLSEYGSQTVGPLRSKIPHGGPQA